MDDVNDDLDSSRKDLHDSLKETSVAMSKSFRRLIIVQFFCMLIIAIAPFAGIYLARAW